MRAELLPIALGAALLVVGCTNGDDIGQDPVIHETEPGEVVTALETTTTDVATSTTLALEVPATTPTTTAADFESLRQAALGDCAVSTWLSEISVDIDSSCVQPFPWDDGDWPIITCDTETGAVVFTTVLVVSPALDALYLVNGPAQTAYDEGTAPDWQYDTDRHELRSLDDLTVPAAEDVRAVGSLACTFPPETVDG